MPNTTSISFDQLSKYFHLPINDVAKELGICATILKKICRRNGIPRWPHRKIKSLNKMIENLESSLQNNTSEAEDCIKQEITILKNKKTLIMKNPSVLANGSKRANQSLDIERPVKKIRNEDGMDPIVMTKISPSSSHPANPSSSLSINQLITPATTSFSTSPGEEPQDAHNKVVPYYENPPVNTMWSPSQMYSYPPPDYHHYAKYRDNAPYGGPHPGATGGGSPEHMRNHHYAPYMSPPTSSAPNGQSAEVTLPKMNLPPYHQQSYSSGRYSPKGDGGSSSSSSSPEHSPHQSYQQHQQMSPPEHYHYAQYKAPALRMTQHQPHTPHHSHTSHPQSQQQSPMVLRWVMEYDKMKK